jgi:hypothetical protein
LAESLSIDHPLRDLFDADLHIREGRFQRSLALLAAASSVLSGLEVAYEHYRGSYSNRIMYTPVLLSGALTGVGVATFFSKRANLAMRWTAGITLADSVIGFYFHVRGIHRKPGGWRVPVANVVMGPPLFAPLLFGTAAYLAFVASYLRREDEKEKEKTLDIVPHGAHRRSWMNLFRGGHQRISWKQDLREGRFQRHVALATALSAIFSGVEALYSHYKATFWHWSQWTPIVISPLLAAAGFGAMGSRRIAHTALPAASALAALDGGVGFFYHSRGVLRRPGGRKHLLYNIMYGPPVFAPLLLGAAGMLGLLASLMRREK